VTTLITGGSGNDVDRWPAAATTMPSMPAPATIRSPPAAATTRIARRLGQRHHHRWRRRRYGRPAARVQRHAGPRRAATITIDGGAGNDLINSLLADGRLCHRRRTAIYRRQSGSDTLYIDHKLSEGDIADGNTVGQRQLHRDHLRQRRHGLKIYARSRTILYKTTTWSTRLGAQASSKKAGEGSSRGPSSVSLPRCLDRRSAIGTGAFVTMPSSSTFVLRAIRRYPSARDGAYHRIFAQAAYPLGP
jgi:hypothetical protein